jgi:hypothetical protein
MIADVRKLEVSPHGQELAREQDLVAGSLVPTRFKCANFTHIQYN